MSSVAGKLCNKCPKQLLEQKCSSSDYFHVISGFTSNNRAPGGPVTTTHNLTNSSHLNKMQTWMDPKNCTGVVRWRHMTEATICIFLDFFSPQSLGYIDVTDQDQDFHTYANVPMNPDESDSNRDIPIYENATTSSNTASPISVSQAVRRTKPPPDGSTTFKMSDTRLSTGYYPGKIDPTYTNFEIRKAAKAPDRLSRFISSAEMRMETFKGMLKQHHWMENEASTQKWDLSRLVKT